MELGIFLWLMCAVAGAAIGSNKGETVSGFLVGLVFGPFGVLFALASRGDRQPCPACKEPVNRKATICPHCRTAIEPKPSFWS